MFPAGFLEAGEGITALPTLITAGTSADFAFFDVIADVALTQVVV